MRYHVKYPWPAKLPEGEEQPYAYGIHRYDQSEADPGFVIVDDAVLPIARQIPADQVLDVQCPIETIGAQDPEKMNEYDRYVHESYTRERAVSDALPEGEIVGALFDLSVADGRAHYVVTKVTKTRATVEWRGYCADRYTDSILGWGKTLPRVVIEEQVRRARAFARLFSPKPFQRKEAA